MLESRSTSVFSHIYFKIEDVNKTVIPFFISRIRFLRTRRRNPTPHSVSTYYIFPRQNTRFVPMVFFNLGCSPAPAGPCRHI